MAAVPWHPWESFLAGPLRVVRGRKDSPDLTYGQVVEIILTAVTFIV